MSSVELIVLIQVLVEKLNSMPDSLSQVTAETLKSVEHVKERGPHCLELSLTRVHRQCQRRLPDPLLAALPPA